ncbi:trihelix transcription factor ASR3-like [Macadamia integrifolia]|uniref:trihelix transcription factor ASR3-like n=1 Tax=Macadamia integrifolia TaxID=60698 RepID=UPI001C5013D7|nr:trihelix transcription factor ASR3-like [Macadamia integrifolia]
MSEPANTSALILLDHRYNDQQQTPPPAAPLVSPGGATTSTSSLVREYRRGNWTLHETLVLITAKKLNDERRIKSSSTPTEQNKPQQLNRTAELRWKWVENYCWNHGCHRSQNQCNDKWDNLLRDYKKVREYEARSEGSNDSPSYWKMEKHERKEKNLPSNLLVEVFQALNQVVQHRYPQRTSTTLPPPPAAPPPPAVSETSNSSETVRSERSESEPKRRKMESVAIGSSIVESATVLARTLLDCEEKKEKRHRDVIELEKRRIQIEETQNEANRQGIFSLIAAVNNLSGAIEAVVSDRFRAGDRM